MLEYAISQAREGKYVIIYCETRGSMGDFARQILDISGAKEFTGNLRLGIKIQIERGHITFEQTGHNFDWKTLRSRGVHPDVVTLLDHWVIERKFPAVVEMLYRFMQESSNKRKLSEVAIGEI